MAFSNKILSVRNWHVLTLLVGWNVNLSLPGTHPISIVARAKSYTASIDADNEEYISTYHIIEGMHMCSSAINTQGY